MNKTDPIRELGRATLRELYESASDADSKVSMCAMCLECRSVIYILNGVVDHNCMNAL